MRGVCVRERKRARERGVNGEGIAPSGGLMERYSGVLKTAGGGEVSRSLSRSPLQPSSRDVTKKQSCVRSARGATRARAPYCIASR